MYEYFQIIQITCEAISQRYFVTIMCMCGYMLNTINRLTFTTLMKNVIFQSHIETKHPPCPPSLYSPNFNNRTSGAEEFLWGTNLQVYISMGHPLGYFLSRLPVGLATDWLGAKTLYGFSVFVPGMISLITPLCARTSPYAILVCRIVDGMFTSVQTCSIAYFAARWFPLKDTGLMLAIVYLGFPLGCSWQFYMSYHAVNALRKWVTAFYINGILSMIWAYIWQAIVWEDPFEHPCIGLKELELLAYQVPMYAKASELKPGWSWPWKSILTSTSVWTLALADVAYTWMFYLIMVIIPVWFFPEVYQCDFTEHAKVAIFVFLMMGLVIIAAGHVSDKLIKARIFNVTHITKTYYATTCVLGSGSVLALTHSSCMLTTAFLYYTCAMICIGIGYTTYIRACISIAPNFVGIVVALTSMLSVASIPLEIYIANDLTADATFIQWRNVSYIFSAFIIFTVGIFLQWGNCNLQPWNESLGKERKHVKQHRSTFIKKINHLNLEHNKIKVERALQRTGILKHTEGLRNEQALKMDTSGTELEDSPTVTVPVEISTQTEIPERGTTKLTHPDTVKSMT